jgi:hypothetical protein
MLGFCEHNEKFWSITEAEYLLNCWITVSCASKTPRHKIVDSNATNYVKIVYTMNYVRSEDLTSVVMKNSIFWDIMRCIPLKANPHFGGTCLLHLQDRRISQAFSACCLLYADFLLGLFFAPEYGDVPPKRQLTFNHLHGVISQKIELFTINYCQVNLTLPHSGTFLFLISSYSSSATSHFQMEQIS